MPILRTVIAAAALFAALPLAGCKPDAAAREAETSRSKTIASQPGEAAPVGAISPGEMQTTNDGRPVISCFGDSLTAGFGLDPDASYPAQLQRLLDAGGYRYRVVNQGVSGDTTKDGLSRIDRVIAAHPYLVIVEFGGNDGLRGLPIASSRANLDSIISKLQQDRVRVALAGITLPPSFGAAYVQQFDATYTTLARQHDVPLYPFILQGAYGVSGSMQPDNIHPTAPGAKQVARNIYTFITPQLKK